jgi:hypothetical protein
MDVCVTRGNSIRLDRFRHGAYHASTMDEQVTVQLEVRVGQRSLDCWFYFYFTPPAELVGLSELRR